MSDEQCAAKCARRVRCQGDGGESPNNISPTGELKKTSFSNQSLPGTREPEVNQMNYN